jgi:hypothetical protein
MSIPWQNFIKRATRNCGFSSIGQCVFPLKKCGSNTLPNRWQISISPVLCYEATPSTRMVKFNSNLEGFPTNCVTRRNSLNSRWCGVIGFTYWAAIPNIKSSEWFVGPQWQPYVVKSLVSSRPSDTQLIGRRHQLTSSLAEIDTISKCPVWFHIAQLRASKRTLKRLTIETMTVDQNRTTK